MVHPRHNARLHRKAIHQRHPMECVCVQDCSTRRRRKISQVVTMPLLLLYNHSERFLKQNPSLLKHLNDFGKYFFCYEHVPTIAFLKRQCLRHQRGACGSNSRTSMKLFFSSITASICKLRPLIDCVQVHFLTVVDCSASAFSSRTSLLDTYSRKSSTENRRLTSAIRKPCQRVFDAFFFTTRPPSCFLTTRLMNSWNPPVRTATIANVVMK